MEIYRSSITELKSHQLNYLEIWSLGSNIPLGLHLANGRKPSVSKTGRFVPMCPLLWNSNFSVRGLSYIQVTPRDVSAEFIYNGLFLVREKLKYLN